MKNIEILVCAHKKDVHTRNKGIYRAIHAGKALQPNLELNYLDDNVGDNISMKNPYYCELTALYWGWKNIHDVEFLGLNHYRRYFDLNITEKNINQLIGNNDMIVAQSETMLSKHERANNLIQMTTIEDFYLFVDTLLYLYPNCKEAFLEYFYSSRKSYPYQMFITRKKIYDEYCEFLFTVLFELEKRVKGHNYSRLKRTMGYIGEWLLGLFIYYKGLKVRPVPVLILDGKSQNKSLKSKIILKIRRFIHTCNDLTYRKPKDIKVPDYVKVGFRNDGIELRTLK